ncbi:hypothetical protein D920_02604 [Enterococcus faecalis 13-SD-W-01]|nr:hypothetical protein D920_02604 [Enterococcus faecalis 13-SD-W-01]
MIDYLSQKQIDLFFQQPSTKLYTLKIIFYPKVSIYKGFSINIKKR